MQKSRLKALHEYYTWAANSSLTSSPSSKGTPALLSVVREDLQELVKLKWRHVSNTVSCLKEILVLLSF